MLANLLPQSESVLHFFYLCQRFSNALKKRRKYTKLKGHNQVIVMMKKPEEILQQVWGYSAFRPMQREIIAQVLEGKDVLAILPTGGGKSLCFQVPALTLPGICLVVSPLIALMKDQVENLNARGIRALLVHSGMSSHEIDVALDNAIYGDYKFLYLSPERLKTPIFKTRVQRMPVNMLAVDEAHCICQWGYDFRPDYLEIQEIRPLLDQAAGHRVPVMALTATATQQVAEDIMKNLDFKAPNLLRSGFERPNLSYVVRRVEDKLGQLLRVCTGVGGSGIVYMRERKKCEELAAFLNAKGVVADFYHAGMTQAERNRKQEAWKKDALRVIVATNAFGMGIDKPDVRFVVHFNVPESLESYFQEAGRAGRDGEKSFAVLLWNGKDEQRMSQIFKVSFPEPDYIKDIYQKVFNYLNLAFEEGEGMTLAFDWMDFVRRYKLQASMAYYAIKYIEMCGYWTLTEELDNPARVMFDVTREDLYNVQLKRKDIDTFVKALMRLYPAIFSQFVRIDEEQIARVTLLSRPEVHERLMELSRMHIIQYRPRQRTPLLHLNNERLVPSNFYLSPKVYEQRKQVFLGRMNAMLDYCRDDGGEQFPQMPCRSRRLLAYFGQAESRDCGVCDLCIKRGVHRVKTQENTEEVIPQPSKNQRDERIVAHVKSLMQHPNFCIDLLEREAGEAWLEYLEIYRILRDNPDRN